MAAFTASVTDPFTESRTHCSLREQGTGNRERENGYQGLLQAQVSQLTTPDAFGDWPWSRR
jgi:hypothetical protein